MNKKIMVDLSTIQRVKKFVDIAEAFECDMEIQAGRYILNAKSIMALFSVNLLEPLLVRIISDNEEEIKNFNAAMEEFKYESYSE